MEEEYIIKLRLNLSNRLRYHDDVTEIVTKSEDFVGENTFQDLQGTITSLKEKLEAVYEEGYCKPRFFSCNLKKHADLFITTATITGSEKYLNGILDISLLEGQRSYGFLNLSSISKNIIAYANTQLSDLEWYEEYLLRTGMPPNEFAQIKKSYGYAMRLAAQNLLAQQKLVDEERIIIEPEYFTPKEKLTDAIKKVVPVVWSKDITQYSIFMRLDQITATDHPDSPIRVYLDELRQTNGGIN